MKLVELLGIPDKGDVFNIEAKVKAIYDREKVDLEYSEFKQNIVIEEGTLDVRVTLWDCELVEKSAKGKTISISQAKKTTYKEKPQLSVDGRAVIKFEGTSTPTLHKIQETTGTGGDEKLLSMILSYAKDLTVASIQAGWCKDRTEAGATFVAYYKLLTSPIEEKKEEVLIQ